MAKKINTEETPNNGEQVSAPEETAPAQTEANAPEQSVTETPKKQEKAVQEDSGAREATNPHTLELLKKFPTYESLYIDSHGGTFSAQTPSSLRGDAVLYKNPYYNVLKRKS